MKLHEQIKIIADRDSDVINKIKHGSVEIVVQDGDIIRNEMLIKEPVKKGELGSRGD